VHESSAAQWADGIRHRQIRQAGIHILRFRNEQVFDDIEGVLAEIAGYLTPSPQAERKEAGKVDSASTPTPNPSPLAGRGTIQEWLSAECLEIGDRVIVDGLGSLGIIEAIEFVFTRETVFDLTVEEDHSFITDAGVVHN
jgi:hypothetical protein